MRRDDGRRRQEALRAALRAGECIVFVGAGISRAASGDGAATWGSLLESGVQRVVDVCGNSVPDGWFDEQSDRIREGNLHGLLEVGGEVEHRLGGRASGEFRLWLRDVLGTLAIRQREVLDAVVDLGAVITTTNYDALLEQAAGTEPVVWTDPARVNRILKGQPGVLHWHGYWDQPESVVLSGDGYQRLEQSSQLAANLQAVRMLKTMVFIGFGAGLQDPHFAALWNWARKVGGSQQEGRHYILLRQDDVAEFDAGLQLRDRLVPLSYGKRHEELPAFLRSLGSGRPHQSVRPTMAPDAFPQVGSAELVVEWGEIMRSRLVKAYRPEWHREWAGGSYKTHRGFLWLEYEAHEPTTDVLRVRVQVESPIREVDAGLNDTKLALVEAILQEFPKWQGISANMSLGVGTRTTEDCVRRYKCTTVINADRERDTAMTDWRVDAEHAIRRLHESIGPGLQEIWSRLAP